MKKSQYIVSACIICLVAWGLYYFLRTEPLVPKESVQQPSNQSQASMSYTGNSIVEEHDGKRIWELSAETIEVDDNTHNVRLKNIKGIFYQENGGRIEITAPEATVDNKTKDVVMVGNVKAVTSDGATFTAQQVNWAESERKVYGNGNVVLTKDDTIITGDKIESDANVEKVKVQGNAQVRKGGTP